MCCLEPTNLSIELQSLKIGADTISWYEKEIEKYAKIADKIAEVNENGEFDEKTWKEFSDSFLRAK